MQTYRLDDIVDQRMIATIFSTTHKAVHNWTVRYSDFPDPIKRFGNTPVYDRDAVRTWFLVRFGRKKFNAAVREQ